LVRHRYRYCNHPPAELAVRQAIRPREDGPPFSACRRARKVAGQLNANFMPIGHLSNACAIGSPRPRGRPMGNGRGSPLPTQNSHSPRPSDLTARFQRPAAVYSRPRYSPLYPGTVNSEPGAGRSGFSYRIDRACTHPHPCTLHRTVQGGTDTTSRAADTANSL
jgi:hypothetical protein